MKVNELGSKLQDSSMEALEYKCHIVRIQMSHSENTNVT